MKTRFIDPLNTFLILFAGILAFIFPFWVFVLSYVILGPLHYLTEINWLNDRDFFFKEKVRWVWLLAATGLISVIVSLKNAHFDELPGLLGSISTSNLILGTFCAAIVLLYVKNRRWSFTIASLTLICAALLPPLPLVLYIFAAFLPTVFHVFLFTGLFMIQGAHKGNSRIGYFNVLLLFIVAMLLLVIPPALIIGIPEFTANFMIESRFNNLHQLISYFIQGNENSFTRIQSFLAFIYAYHYLNWFSKTGVIGWHTVAKSRLVISITIWIAAIMLYLIDLKLGLAVLFSLSILHVFLEFPLNIKSIDYILNKILFKKPFGK
jgi:hypothetical protein